LQESIVNRAETMLSKMEILFYSNLTLAQVCKARKN
ncbi:hypothetical protein T02_2119, partial [Trichinella nativa]